MRGNSGYKSVKIVYTGQYKKVFIKFRMSVFNRINGSFSLGHSNYLFLNFKHSKCNLKYRKLYVCCQLRKSNASGK